MRDEPSDLALIDIARRALLDEVAPALSGRPRFVALMAANALGVAARDLAGAARLAQAWAQALGGEQGDGEARDAAARKLCADIRNGGRDGDEDLYFALVETAAAASRIWKPSRAAET